MLIDFIPIEKLPYVIVWIDWCIFAYWKSLLIAFLASILVYWVNTNHHSFEGIILALFVGFCSWVPLCVIRNGYAVG